MNVPFLGLPRQYAVLKDELLEASDRVLSSGMLMNGPFTPMLEDWLTSKTLARYAITCHSGTQALEIIAKFRYQAYMEYYSGKADPPSVQIPNLTYPATLNAWLSSGFRVELVDTDRNGLMTRQNFDRSLAAVVECPVGLFGASPARVDLWDTGTVYDGAQHWLIHNEPIGYATAISFDPTKNLPSSGNGGAILTDREKLRDFAMDYRANGTTSHHTIVGSNSRMSEQDCAQLLVRARHIDDWQARRHKIKLHWCEAFRDLPCRCLSDDVPRHSDQKFAIWTEDRNDLDFFLRNKGIQTKMHYPYTLGELPIAKNIPHPDAMSKSVMLSRGLLSLPIYPELSDIEVEYITAAVKEFFRTK